MFSVQQKRDIADKVQTILRETGHPELPEGEIEFALHVDGAVTNPDVNPWNEKQAQEVEG